MKGTLRKKRYGFTLIEIMVAITVIVAGLHYGIVKLH